MMKPTYTYLIFGGTGRTGKHFIELALREGHRVRALVRNPEKLEIKDTNLEVVVGTILDYEPLDTLLTGVDFVVSMLGDARRQQQENVNTAFVKRLIPAMRRQGVKRFLYQAGGFTRPYKQALPLMSWLLKHTLVRFSGLLGQHRDNEAVLAYLVEEAMDIEWMVHRASLYGDKPSQGALKRSETKFNIACFVDCAHYSYNLLSDASAIHSYDLSYYQH
ncbi:NAD(P)-dependent oxidoreductase [Hymenobacter negativus]|uniref:NAD(P)H-binding protein n=1 Tax=Hymenobacter negativus TaxID=2795026 RepID=A0ABS3QPF0_9BACT|nr:NAD(P)H-binding protein [Hymenobacter negativus]MBO2012951.1 NAD(P)H-binding protein [Hymenobacter negativus]